MLQTAFALLKEGGSLTSYCVKSEVRRHLAQIGFEVERLPGPVAGKREVLKASRPQRSASE